jgi:DNA mismatch repair protein MutL
VLKELVENALDAGATSIDVAWEEGGRKLLEVADDGCGMARDDLYLALERHATSKIASADDLSSLASYGFRGEALPSIGSVARLDLHSSRSDGEGNVLRCEFGAIRDVRPMPRAKGTTVTVRDIFMQLPARKRFLKTADTEHAHLWATVTRLALAAPNVRWIIRSDRSGELILPKVHELRQRAALLLGDKMEKLVPFGDGEEPWRIHGYLSPPYMSFRDRNHLYLFANGRPVRDRLMLSALSRGWEGYFQKGTFPAVILFLDIPAESVDVNVHPTKSEVRFKDPQHVFPWISRAAKDAWGGMRGELPGMPDTLGRASGQLGDGPGNFGGNAPSVHSSHSAHHQSLSFPPRPPSGGNYIETLKSLQMAFPKSQERPYTFSTNGGQVAEAKGQFFEDTKPIRYLGSFLHTYLLAEYGTGGAAELWIVDQHVAHERVIYEQLFLRKNRPAIQPLLPPQVVSLGRAGFAKLSPFLDEMCSVGIEAEAFGGDAITIRALPDFLAKHSPESLIDDLLASIESGAGADLDNFRKNLNSQLACRTAIKKNHALDELQAQSLLESLVECQTPLTCPHGRPVMKKITLAELERSFGRKG